MYHLLSSMLLKELQKQQQPNLDQLERIEALESQNADLQRLSARVERLEAVAVKDRRITGH